jgi:hypothetical protein
MGAVLLDVAETPRCLGDSVLLAHAKRAQFGHTHCNMEAHLLVGFAICTIARNWQSKESADTNRKLR